MIQRLIPLTIFVLSTMVGIAQQPQSIILQKSTSVSHTDVQACADQFAGTIDFTNFMGQSNDTNTDVIYFCFGDQIDIVHNGDSDLTGDPNPGTLPGVTYAFFTCPPTIQGPNLNTILGDACILDMPPPANGLWISSGGMANGNTTFFNDGTLQSFFNGGDPVQIWFAPITIDDFDNKEYEVDPVSMEAGPCVNVNTAETFSVVYLNEIASSNQMTTVGDALCRGSFMIEGGLPEFDGTSFYDISIVNVGNPTLVGEVINGDAVHGKTMQFDVPAAGVYQISVADGKGCTLTFLMSMVSCVSVEQSLPSVSVAPLSQVCLDVVNEDNFLSLVSMQYSIIWDDTVLEFDTIINLNPNLPSLNANNSFNSLGDALIFTWFDPTGGNGSSLPDGDLLYTVCFNVIGVDGDCTPVEFSNSPTIIEVVNGNNQQLGFNGIDGEVCVTNNALNVMTDQQSVSCFGETDGNFTITVSGGLAPYQFNWEDTNGPLDGSGTINISGGDFTVPNLPSGTFSITVTDSSPGNPIISSTIVEVLSPPKIDLIVNEFPPMCNGDLGQLEVVIVENGEIVNDPSSYDIEWSSGDITPQTSLIAPGLYSITVTAPNDCTATDNAILPQPPPINLNITFDTATCSGINDGTIMLFVNGGTPDNNGDYTIEWCIGDGLTFINNISNVSGLEAGCYCLTVTDANGCSVNETICLPARKILSVNATIENIQCEGEQNGSIFIVGTTTGDVPAVPYNFIWMGNPPPPPAINDATTSTVNGLATGDYTLTMQDQAGCEIDTTFMITDPIPLTIDTISITPASCNPGNDGAAEVLASGGTNNFTYEWNTVPPITGAAVNLPSGTWTVTASDDNNCTITADITINMPLPPIITELLDDQVSCSGSEDGSLTVTAMEGNSPIDSYDWSPMGMGQTINDLEPGEYIVTVTDQNGCIATDTALVLAPEPLILDSIFTELPNCPGQSGGVITVFISGGTQPYSYEWNPPFGGITFPTLGNVIAGTYMVTVTDNNDCPPLVVETTLNDPPSIEIDFSTIAPVSCATNTCDGSAVASALYSDGTTGTFNFMWSSTETDNAVTSSTAIQLCAGEQTVEVSDGVCFNVDTLMIPAPPAIVPDTADISPISCAGLFDGSITLVAQGGTPPYTFLWDDGTVGPTNDNLGAGMYAALITDNNGCTFTHGVTIEEPQPLILSLNSGQTFDVACPEDTTGVITVFPEGGNINLGPVIYTWTNGVSSSTTAESLSAGTYSVTATDIKGCQDTLTHTLAEPAPIEFDVGTIEDIQCFGGNTFVTVESVFGGNNVTYQFFVDNGVNRLLGEPAPVFGGEHTITVWDQTNGCTSDTIVSIFEPQPIVIQIPEIVEIELGDTLSQLNPTIISSLPIDTFLWSPSTQLSCADCKNPFVQAIESQLFTLTVIDVNGCLATQTVFVDIDANRNVYIPNIFSPNDDGSNDIFRVYTGLGVENIQSFRVFDRWGELMFEAEDLGPSPDGSMGWDGRFNGERMKPGVFVYLIEVNFLDGSTLIYRGDVTLIR